MKKLLLLGALAFSLNTFGQDATYYFEIAPGHVSLQITQSGTDYTVVNLDEYCQGFQANFLLNDEYDHYKGSEDGYNTINYEAQESQVGITAFFDKQTNDLVKILFWDETGEDNCWGMGGEYYYAKKGD